MLKIILVLSMLVFSVSSCGANTKQSEDKTTTSTKDSLVKVLSDELFFSQMIDTEKSEATKNLTFKNSKPMVIDFYADWCGPCVKSKPYYEEFATKHHANIDFYRIDIDKYKEVFTLLNKLVGERGGIPFFIFVNAKGEVDYLTGWDNNISPKLFETKFEWLMGK